ncbi:MAG: hypothetical protein A3J07_00015 [Candidatus Doudnabacteria bacterium RIFCSPLOWO2_02_FULL_49_13]|uniref:Transglycosylase SLT domain-containing protein n=1 Tax=Candidatus Doudnabacteria bacterium RIFCSPHIGHO2_12_FULL_48_16 TaxID=1817838 RepID=A0A1F5PLM9_9BACT|nr:MAG: hypothetical protein A3B77_00335 [Candidatus Doudnabacteria bacterium RIFCSPHIGHO2_02_FULL_49_24]OGE89508.1 MAG: hypothetical protein A2760_02665 [Candidatus Doudnabacteria bacterium RIFCSPHIGHO2_01_FULL_50_67]OGE90777.1 MAG: hypothetical protein A3E29_01480 [Candidatus Doudnabacteria bacterium RIFCSPHIGHO2_12_FULL_48_16]OGE97410.1 MAG: hypothetical protein A2990_01300 [Candidatus Doudnabacteria bacterium RIFCSPLOWO2_01_FULL_49_40]OGF02281.1 MAG: hypothetical protein A3J07_00015 [Candid
MLRISRTIIVTLALIVATVAFSFVAAQSAPDEKSQLQQQLLEIERQIAEQQQQLKQIQGEKNTLQKKINQLKKQQATLNLQIQATNLQLSQIETKLAETQAEIDHNQLQQGQIKEQLKLLITQVYQQQGNYSLLYLLLSQQNLSDILTEMQSYSVISDSLHDLLVTGRNLDQQLQENRVILSTHQEDASNLLSIQNLQRGQISGVVTEQNSILQETKGKESNYQASLSNTQKRANEIRSRLYQLLGVSTQISFGQAVEIATWASGQTGVRASFLLAILTQESNLGKNVGTCNRPGDPATKSYKVVMKPTRDIEPFLAVTAELGMDPEVTPVSCPMKNKDGSFNGWGGAMGPAQFIPSTWMGYKNKVSAITGKLANPWDIRDAFLASAIKLKAGGAGTVAGEWAAAMRYFSGGTNTKYRFYGDNVVAMANQYQADIDNLNQ